MIELRKLNQFEPDIMQVEMLYSNEFNTQIYPTFEKILKFSEKADIDILGIYEANSLIGFMIILKDYDLVYLAYFAISTQKQCNGFGTQALQEVLKKYSDCTFVLDIENDSEDLTLFQRRRKFYIKNGFFETKHIIEYSGMKFLIFSNDINFNFQHFKEWFINMNQLFIKLN